eukprot:scaffold36639_cov99-Phaeocystis_antarctica.AAC.1
MSVLAAALARTRYMYMPRLRWVALSHAVLRTGVEHVSQLTRPVPCLLKRVLAEGHERDDLAPVDSGRRPGKA